jgi:hypothetical protein
MKKDSNVKIVGQKYAKYAITSIDFENLYSTKSKLPYAQQVVNNLNMPPFDQMLENQIDAVWSILEIKGYDITGKNMLLFRWKYVKEKPLTAEENKNKYLALMEVLCPEKLNESYIENLSFEDDPKKFIKPFTFLYLCTKFILAAKLALAVDLKTEARLDQAYEAGYLYKTLMVLPEYNAIQKKIAANLRKPKLAEIFDDLKRRKAGGEKPKELWPHFISALDDENRLFDIVEEHKPNPGNAKSWYVTYLTIDRDDKGAKERGPEKMKYENYLRRLSSK